MAEFKTKKEAEDYARKRAVENLSQKHFIINEKKDILGEIYFDSKLYTSKPKLAKKDGRAILPAYNFVLIGSAHIG